MANKGQTAIIGSGLIGTSWAVIFSKAGYDVVMYDSDEAALGRAKDRAQAQASALAAQDLLPADAKVDEILGRISYTSSLKDAIQNAFYIQECTPEVLDIKKQVFKQLDPFLGPDCIVGSSTSFMPCSKFTEDIQGRDRCMVCHPVNPPFAVPLVEVVPSEWTRQDLVQRAIQFLQQVGMQPIQVKREIDGFVLNRLQYALLAEAYRLVEDGVASAEDVDKCIKYGLGRRWSFMGPFETIDLNAPGGVQDYCNRYTSGILRVVKTQDNNREWKQSTIDEIERDLRKTTPQDGLGDRCQWRDNRLLALEGHFRQQPQGPPRGEE